LMETPTLTRKQTTTVKWRGTLHLSPCTLQCVLGQRLISNYQGFKVY
jgi:hypothetical protein